MTGATGRETSAPAFHPRLKPGSRFLLFVFLTFNTSCAFSRVHGGPLACALRCRVNHLTALVRVILLSARQGKTEIKGRKWSLKKPQR